jgi:hypothetical protein
MTYGERGKGLEERHDPVGGDGLEDLGRGDEALERLRDGRHDDPDLDGEGRGPRDVRDDGGGLGAPREEAPVRLRPVVCGGRGG